MTFVLSSGSVQLRTLASAPSPEQLPSRSRPSPCVASLGIVRLSHDFGRDGANGTVPLTRGSATKMLHRYAPPPGLKHRKSKRKPTWPSRESGNGPVGLPGHATSRGSTVLNVSWFVSTHSRRVPTPVCVHRNTAVEPSFVIRRHSCSVVAASAARAFGAAAHDANLSNVSCGIRGSHRTVSAFGSAATHSRNTPVEHSCRTPRAATSRHRAGSSKPNCCFATLAVTSNGNDAPSLENANA